MTKQQTFQYCIRRVTTTIETQLRSEIARATLAETSESNRAVAAESALLTNLESTNNRLSRETNQLSWKIANESMRAREAEQNETFRAIAAETAIEATLRSSIESDKASFISTIEHRRFESQIPCITNAHIPLRFK